MSIIDILLLTSTSLLLLVAKFAISAVESVAENSPTFIVCTIMMTSSASLDLEVALSLSTVDGTG